MKFSKFLENSNLVLEASSHIEDTVWNCADAKNSDLRYLNSWLDDNGVYYDMNLDAKRLRILIDPELEQSQMLKLKQLLDSFGIYKIWENVGSSAPAGTATLGNTNGMGSVSMPNSMGSGVIGSGDNFGTTNSVSIWANNTDEDEEVEERIRQIIEKCLNKNK